MLTAVSGGIACSDIGNAEKREEKNEIFVEFVGSAGGSALAGYALAAIFVYAQHGHELMR